MFYCDFFEACDEIARVSNPYPGQQSFEDAYSRVFVCNQRLKENEDIIPSNQLYNMSYKETREYFDKFKNIKPEDIKASDVINVTPQSKSTIKEYSSLMEKNLANRRFCATSKGYLGWLCDAGEAGDIVCIFAGSNVPYLLRPDDDGYYKLIGECYIQGIMYGEALTNNALVKEKFKIR